MSTPSEFLDAVLVVCTAGFFIWLSYVTIDGLVCGDQSGAAASALFAAMNGLIAITAFRRLRASVRSRAKKQAQGPHDWKGDPIK
jgi:hypothetical protein